MICQFGAAKLHAQPTMETGVNGKEPSVVRRIKVFVLGDEAQSKEERWLVQKLGEFTYLGFCSNSKPLKLVALT